MARRQGHRGNYRFTLGGNVRRACGRVLERGKQVFPVRVIRPMGGTALLCHPTDPRLDFGIVVEPDEAVVTEPVLDDNGREVYPAESVDTEVDFSRVSRGDILLVAPGEQINPSLWEGRILKMLGDEDDAIVQEAIVKANHGIPLLFRAGSGCG